MYLIAFTKEKIINMVDLNIEEQKILDYLENSYTGARTMNDEERQIRLARAIAAFKSDPMVTPTALFTPKFIDNYCL